VLPQTPLLHWGREEKEKEWKGREDRKAEEKGSEGHGEEVRGGEKERGEGRRGRNGPPLFGSSLRLWQCVICARGYWAGRAADCPLFRATF